MPEGVIHTVPKTSTVRDYFRVLWIALTNQDMEFFFSKAAARDLYRRAYPKAKV